MEPNSGELEAVWMIQMRTQRARVYGASARVFNVLVHKYDGVIHAYNGVIYEYDGDDFFLIFAQAPGSSKKKKNRRAREELRAIFVFLL